VEVVRHQVDHVKLRMQLVQLVVRGGGGGGHHGCCQDQACNCSRLVVAVRNAAHCGYWSTS
jgi:hypothetical protein